jgi:hypothetical protein
LYLGDLDCNSVVPNLMITACSPAVQSDLIL